MFVNSVIIQSIFPLTSVKFLENKKFIFWETKDNVIVHLLALNFNCKAGEDF